MITTRAPLRISFFGGGSDLPGFFREEEGCVVSATIDRWVTVRAGNDGITSDCPLRASGLGSSSAFAVAMFRAIMPYASKGHCARHAVIYETEVLKKPIGCQDQWASAAGGLNRFAFLPGGDVDVESLACPPGFWDHLLVLKLLTSRASDAVHREHAS